VEFIFELQLGSNHVRPVRHPKVIAFKSVQIRILQAYIRVIYGGQGRGRRLYTTRPHHRRASGGALDAQLDAATADQEAAMAAYGLALLKAFEEVEAALTDEGLYEEREHYLESVVHNNKRAYDLARQKYDVGQTDFLSVIQIQTKWLGTRMGLIHIMNERLALRVNLHLALGGSFEIVETP
jgi:hypothetical protein